MSLDFTLRSGRIEGSSTAESALLTISDARPARTKVVCEPRANEVAYRVQIGDGFIDIIVPNDTAMPVLVQASGVRTMSYGTDPSPKALTVNPPRPPAPPSHGN